MTSDDIRNEVAAAFVELHGKSHAQAVSDDGVRRATEMFQRAQRLVRRRLVGPVALAAWAAYRDEMARPKARAAARAGRGAHDGSTTGQLATEPDLAVRYRAEGRGARRRASRVRSAPQS